MVKGGGRKTPFLFFFDLFDLSVDVPLCAGIASHSWANIKPERATGADVNFFFVPYCQSFPVHLTFRSRSHQSFNIRW